MTWSWSRLTSFDDCPYMWFQRYILEEEEEPMFYASYGSFVHSLIERYYSGELAKEQLLPEFLRGFSDNVKGERPQESTVAKYIAAGAEYFRNFRPFPFEPVAVEKKIDFDLDGLRFTAIPDFVGIRDGKLAIVDNKSREMKPRSRKNSTAKDRELDEMLGQLYIYAEGVRQAYGELPKVLCFNSFRNGKFIEEPFDLSVFAETKDWAKRQADGIAGEEEFRPYVDWFKCKYLCGYHNDCCYWKGGDR